MIDVLQLADHQVSSALRDGLGYSGAQHELITRPTFQSGKLTGHTVNELCGLIWGYGKDHALAHVKKLIALN